MDKTQGARYVGQNGEYADPRIEEGTRVHEAIGRYAASLRFEIDPGEIARQVMPMTLPPSVRPTVRRHQGFPDDWAAPQYRWVRDDHGFPENVRIIGFVDDVARKIIEVEERVVTGAAVDILRAKGYTVIEPKFDE